MKEKKSRIVCPACQGQKFYLERREVGQAMYVAIICARCGILSNLGQVM